MGADGIGREHGGGWLNGMGGNARYAGPGMNCLVLTMLCLSRKEDIRDGSETCKSFVKTVIIKKETIFNKWNV